MQELRHSGPRDGAHGENGMDPDRAFEVAGENRNPVRRNEVRLREADEPRPACELGVVAGELVEEEVVPPRATTRSVSPTRRSASCALVVASNTTVPGGTRITRSSPSAPVLLFPWPARPRGARYVPRLRKSRRVLMRGSVWRMTCPPRPP